jgi:hypothetical protein
MKFGPYEASLVIPGSHLKLDEYNEDEEITEDSVRTHTCYVPSVPGQVCLAPYSPSMLE